MRDRLLYSTKGLTAKVPQTLNWRLGISGWNEKSQTKKSHNRQAPKLADHEIFAKLSSFFFSLPLMKFS